MMKRILSLLLVLCLLAPLAAQAGVSAYIKDDTEATTGPGFAYWDPGIRLSNGTTVTAISRTWDDYNGVWQILVEFRLGYDLCRAYVVGRRIYTTVSDIPVESALQSCYLITDADAFAGPGITYTLWSDTIYSGTSATLLAVENDWGFIECWNSTRQAYWRVWVPLYQLSCGDRYLSSNTPVYYRYLPEIPTGGIRAGCGNSNSIKWVQQCLRSCGYGQLAVDGNWGQQTNNAVLAFCRDNGFGNCNVVDYDIACAMLYMFYSKGMPLSYLEHYIP